MSYTITTDVFCDKCGDWTSGATGNSPQRKEALRIAKSRGFTVKDKKVLCPICNGKATDKGKYGYHWKDEK